LTYGFRRNNEWDGFFDFDYLICSNHTSLYLASAIQLITGKTLIMLDRLGPIPSKIPILNERKTQISGKRGILIEEVMATGSEVDRSIIYLSSMNTSIDKVLTFFNLEIGKPLSVESDCIISLCKPKDDLGYVYRSG
jgi:hypothetical protein